MERRVKERLIGASILVVLLVLIVPELLSGPPQKPPSPATLSLPKPAGGSTAAEPVRSVTVDLNTSKPTAAEPESESESAASAADKPAAEPSAPPAVAPTVSAPPPATTPAPSPPRAAPLETPLQSPTSTAGWSVQLGSFANRANAENLVRQLKGQGYGAYVAPLGSGRSERFRVRVGPATDRGGAERVQAKLKGQGHAGSLVSPGGK